jgi:hypothetical protein
VGLGFEKGTQFPVKIMQGIFDRQRYATAERAKAGLFHGVEQVVEQFGVDFEGLVFAGFGDEFVTSGATEAAGETFAAAFIGGELKQVLDVLNHRQ